MEYCLKPKPEKSAKALGVNLRVSTKNSVIVCKAIRGKTLEKGKKLLEDLIDKKRSLNGKYYTNACKEILEVLKSAEANAEFKGLDLEKLIIHASAHKGFSFWTPRRFKLRRRRKKTTNIQIILIQR